MNMSSPCKTAIHSLIHLLFNKEERIVCYHCDDTSRKSKTVYVKFDGSIRPVCCQGCAAILRTVEQLGMQEEYKARKTHHYATGR